jgi:hypothetical protein
MELFGIAPIVSREVQLLHLVMALQEIAINCQFPAELKKLLSILGILPFQSMDLFMAGAG